MSNSFKSLLITKNENQLLFTLTNKVIVQREDIQKHYNMLKHKDEFEPVWNNQWMGYNMLVGYGNYSKLDLPRFEYIRVSWNTLRYPNDYYLYPHLFKGFVYNQVFNEFDESYVSSISKSDTLAIREYLYSFSKR